MMQAEEAVPQELQQTIDLFVSKIFSDDPLTMVVKAHLYLESALVALMQAYCENPDVLESDKLNFPSKVQLCIALGLLESDLEQVLGKVNKLRNRFVHNLEARLGKRDAFDLMASLTQTDQRAIGYQLKKVGAGRSTHMEMIGMTLIWLYTRLVMKAHGLALLRGAGLSRDEILQKLQEIA